MGADAKAVAGAVRISFAETTTEDEIMEAAGKIAAEVKTIRRYMR